VPLTNSISPSVL